MDTLIHIKGVLREPITAVGPWWKLWPIVVVEQFKSMKFSASHNTRADLFQAVNQVMMDIMKNQGISVIKDEGRSTKDVDNLEFWPMHNFRCIQVEALTLNAAPYTGTVQ